MAANFKQYKPKDIFISACPGSNEVCHKTGCAMIDKMIENIHGKGVCSAKKQAEMLGIDYVDFIGAIKVFSGLSSDDFLDQYALLMAQNLIDDGQLTMKEICNQLGFDSYSGFYRFMKRHNICKPKCRCCRRKQGETEPKTLQQSDLQGATLRVCCRKRRKID